MKQEGKVAIVTGSAQGIGKAIAMRFASEGATVVITDANIELGEQVANDIISRGGKAIAFQMDASKKDQVSNVVKSTLEHLKAVHILVNNASIVREAPILEMTEE